MVSLVPDCARCAGLCCVVLPFQRSSSFAFSKDAGTPCRHLTASTACGIHASLLEAGMSGCVAYECFGAGQQVTQVTYGGAVPRAAAEVREVGEVFEVVRRLLR